ncbi:MAG TPA: Fe-Mn family superoxide dismutase, partial [Caulobacteraceae bacterium]
GKPSGDVAAAIDRDFGSLQAFRDAFINEGVSHFASGWVWLVSDAGTLKVISTHDGDSAIAHDATPILTVDLWEHAYYLDHQNLRKRFLEQVFDNALNWDFAARQFAAADGQGEAYKYPAPV